MSNHSIIPLPGGREIHPHEDLTRPSAARHPP